MVSHRLLAQSAGLEAALIFVHLHHTATVYRLALIDVSLPQEAFSGNLQDLPADAALELRAPGMQPLQVQMACQSPGMLLCELAHVKHIFLTLRSSTGKVLARSLPPV